MIDIGTGDGRFVYRSARRRPDRFYIGIDAEPTALAKISTKILRGGRGPRRALLDGEGGFIPPLDRKPAKGGLPNVLFVHAPVESLPPELDGVADEVHVHFPWGSLLRAVTLGEEQVLHGLRRLCASGAWLEIVIGLDAERDRAELERLGVPPLSPGYMEQSMIPRYRAAGFEVAETGALSAAEWCCIESSWARRLSVGNPGRMVSYLLARAVGISY